MTEQRAAWGFGLATVHESGTVLDTWYPWPHLGPATESDAPPELTALAGKDERRGVRLEVLRTELIPDFPGSAADRDWYRDEVMERSGADAVRWMVARERLDAERDLRVLRRVAGAAGDGAGAWGGHDTRTMTGGP